MTALRHLLRQDREWEVFREHATNNKIDLPERDNSIEDELRAFIREDEVGQVCPKANRCAAILALQSKHLRALKERKLTWEFSFLDLEGILRELLTLQGKYERIKNFPYPRQDATMSYYIVAVFLLLLRFGVIPEFSEIGDSATDSFPFAATYLVWLGAPFTAMVSWVFRTMQRIGAVGENPLEGSANDVPISTIARAIEMDLRQMIDEQKDNKIPEPLAAVHGVQM